MELEELVNKYKVMEKELSQYPKSELINFLLVKELLDEDGRDLWWAVDKDGTGHLFNAPPKRSEEAWVSGSTENSLTIGSILNEYYEKELTWADEPVQIRIKF